MTCPARWETVQLELSRHPDKQAFGTDAHSLLSLAVLWKIHPQRME
jgi:hypothetical protein